MNYARTETTNQKYFKTPSTETGANTSDPLGSVRASNVSVGGLFECFNVDDNGSLWLNRKLRDHWIATDRPVLAIFIQILMRVQWKDDAKTVFINGCGIKLKRGQMTCGAFQMCQWASVSRQEYRTSITKLKSTNTVTIQSTNKFSIISLVNWAKYQNINHKSTIRATNEQPTSNQRATTLEEGKKVRKKELKNKAFTYPQTKKQRTTFEGGYDEIQKRAAILAKKNGL